MFVKMDAFDLLDWMDGCAGRSHLRQGIWARAIDEFFSELTQAQREKIYTYAKRDLLERFIPRLCKICVIEKPGLEEFLQFLSRYNPNNQYVVKLEKEVKGKVEKDTAHAYKYNDMYMVGSNKWCAPKAIKSVRKTPIKNLCNNEYCLLADECARYNKLRGTRRIQHINCDEFIFKGTTHGVDPEKLKVQKL